MKTDINGIDTNNKHLRLILENWFKVIRKYGRTLKWENLHWEYRERAHVGMLAAAAWTSGCVALEEYSATKRHFNDPRHKHTGRCDLYFQIPGGPGFIAEARQVTVALPMKKKGARSAPGLNKVNQKIEEVLNEAKRLTEPEIRLGVVFVSLRSKQPSLSDLRKDVLAWKRRALKLAKVSKCTAFAWIFPKIDRLDLLQMPGTAVFIKEVAPSKR